MSFSAEIWYVVNWMLIAYFIISLLIQGIMMSKRLPIYGYPMTIYCLCNNLIVMLASLFYFCSANMCYFPVRVLIFSSFFEINVWTNFVSLFLLFMFILFIILFKFYIKYIKLDFEYLILTVFSFFGLYMLASTSDFLSFFLVMELYSLPSYVLISSKVYSPKSTEAGLKYFILGCFFSALLLFGISSLYFVTGTTNFYTLQELLFMQWNQKENIIIFSLILILISFAFKISAVPFHMGTPDAYEGAPLIITAFLNVFPKIPIFTAYFNIFYKCFNNYTYIYSTLIVIISICSILIANFSIIFQHKIIRILTYSTISNTGFFVLPMALNDPYAIALMFFFQLVYSLIMLGIFYILLSLRLYFNLFVFDKVSSLLNFVKENSSLALVFSIFLFSLGSIPPVSGFFGKYVYLVGVLDVNLFFVALILLFGSVLSLIVYLRILKIMFFSDDKYNWNVYVPLPFSYSCGLIVLCVTNFLIVLIPEFSVICFFKIYLSFFL